MSSCSFSLSEFCLVGQHLRCPRPVENVMKRSVVCPVGLLTVTHQGGGSMRRGQHTCRPGPTYLFSPRGMHAPRAVCSACVNFFLFLINLWAKITLDVLDQFSPLSDDLWAVGMATNFRVKIGKIRPFTFIRSRGILKQIAISPFWFLKQVYLHESAMIRLDYV